MHDGLRGETMSRLVLLSFVYGISIFAAVILNSGLASAFSTSESFNLKCFLVGRPGGVREYILHVEIPKFVGKPQVMLMVESNTHALNIKQLDDTIIIAQLELTPLTSADSKFTAKPGMMKDSPDKTNAQEFRINRITGYTEVNYLRQSVTPDGNRWGVGSDEFAEKGTCSKAERAF